MRILLIAVLGIMALLGLFTLAVVITELRKKLKEPACDNCGQTNITLYFDDSTKGGATLCLKCIEERYKIYQEKANEKTLADIQKKA